MQPIFLYFSGAPAWFCIILMALFFPRTGKSQQLTFLTQLSPSLSESSGLIWLNNQLISHNDSGGDPKLYEMDTLTGAILRTVVVENAQNKDWEDICYDETYIYIADIGNNNGTRTDLRIYRVTIDDYFAGDTVQADTIRFAYQDQTDFSPAQFETNFDAESLITFRDSLYIFTKNWGNNQTNIYALPKTPGIYQAAKIKTLDSRGLITGATYHTLSGKIMVTGHTLISAFVVELTLPPLGAFVPNISGRYNLQAEASYQIEAITPFSLTQYYLTAEGGLTGDPALYRLQHEIPTTIYPVQQNDTLIFPNPASKEITIKGKNITGVGVYTVHGQFIDFLSPGLIDVSRYPRGWYTLFIWKHGQSLPEIKQLLIQ